MTAAVPSDQTVRDGEAFRAALRDGRGARRPMRRVVILGVPPDAPRDRLRLRRGRTGDARRRASSRSPGPRRRASSRPRGRHSLERGHLRLPAVAVSRRGAARGGELVAGVEAVRAHAARQADYEALPDISIDYAVMEKIAGVRAVPLRAGWSDVGTWRAVRELQGAERRVGQPHRLRPCRCSRPGCATRRSSSASGECWCSPSTARRS